MSDSLDTLPAPEAVRRYEAPAFTLPNVPFGAVIFDCDGTLANSMPLHLDAWARAFEHFGAPFVFDSKLFMTVAGVGHEDTVTQLNERYGCSLDPAKVVPFKEKWYDDHLHTIVGIDDVTRYARLCHENGVTIAVASGGPRPHVNETLRIIGVNALFEVVCTQDDVTRSKPAPDLFLLAAERLGVEPSNCIVLEDSPLGIAAAEDAGMVPVLVKSLI